MGVLQRAQFFRFHRCFFFKCKEATEQRTAFTVLHAAAKTGDVERTVGTAVYMGLELAVSHAVAVVLVGARLRSFRLHGCASQAFGEARGARGPLFTGILRCALV